MSLTVHTNKTKHHLSTTVAPTLPALSPFPLRVEGGRFISLTPKPERGHLSIHDMFLPTRHFPNLSYTVFPSLSPRFILSSFFLFSINSPFPYLSTGNYGTALLREGETRSDGMIAFGSGEAAIPRIFQGC